MYSLESPLWGTSYEYPQHIFVENKKLNPFSHVNPNSTYANSVAPDEMAVTSRLIRIYTVCHLVLDFCLIALLATMVVSKIKDGRVLCRNSGMKVVTQLFDWKSALSRALVRSLILFAGIFERYYGGSVNQGSTNVNELLYHVLRITGSDGDVIVSIDPKTCEMNFSDETNLRHIHTLSRGV